MRNSTEVLIHAYYNSFNRKDVNAFIDVLSDDIVHDINQGGREIGKPAFRAFIDHMNHCYDEKVVDLEVMTNEKGDRAAAEFTVLGAYLATDAGLPPARGQRYRLPAGAFFELKDGKISRMTGSYNVNDWLRQVQS